MSRPFLTAEWRNLFIATYAVPPSLLEKRLPPGLELDTRDGDAFVSLVAFEFLRTAPQFPLLRSIVPRVSLGNFPEINLRFYVRLGAERGVVFVRECVPRRLVAWLARVLYNEQYVAAPMYSTVREEPERLTVEHRLSWGGKTYTLSVTGAKPPVRPAETSDEHFFKEHHWGFCVSRRGLTIRYEVQHPVWEIYPVQSWRLDFDWAHVYGPEWKILNGKTPCSTVLAAGSGVSVFPKGALASSGAPCG